MTWWPPLVVAACVVLAASLHVVAAYISKREKSGNEGQSGTIRKELDVIDIPVESLVALFKSHTKEEAKKLITPYIDRWIVASGFVVDTYFQTLKEGTTSVLLKSPPDTNIVAHLSEEHRSRGLHLLNGCEVKVLGQIISVEQGSISLDSCEPLEVKLPARLLK
jgi:hypothetical protein